jgi:phosphatidyl-myo-inositol dimannoside synthase
MTQPRVLYLTPDLFGPPSGIARYCRMVCRALVANDLATHVVSLMDKPSAQIEAHHAFPLIDYQACQGSRIKFIGRALLLAACYRPTLVLIGHPNFAPMGWALRWLSGARIVSFVYGVDVWSSLPALTRRALQQSDRVIAISQFTAKKATQVNGVTSDKIQVLYNCLDPQFEQVTPRQASADNLSMLTVARIGQAEHFKGHDMVIRALPRLLTQFPSLVYDVVGDGPGRVQLEEMARQMGISHAVRFHGVVSEVELKRYYANATLFIMPSAHEGFGFVFVEAMSQGVPAIGGNQDATPEVIANEETGFLVDPASIDEIAEAATRILANGELRQRMGQAAIEHVTRQFSFGAFERKLSAHLSNL